MTRSEAIKELQEAYDIIRSYDIDSSESRLMAALDMAIKALEQEPCEDAVSRQAVLDGLASIAKVKARSDAQKSLMGRVMFFVEQLPSVKPQEPKTGYWILADSQDNVDVENGNNRYICSECTFSDIHAKSTEVPYCWHCGARMESEI